MMKKVLLALLLMPLLGMVFVGCKNEAQKPFAPIATSMNDKSAQKTALLAFHGQIIPTAVDTSTLAGVKLVAPFKVKQVTLNNDGSLDFTLTAGITIADRAWVNGKDTEPRIVGVGDGVMMEIKGKTYVNNVEFTVYTTLNEANRQQMAKIERLVICSRQSRLFQNSK